MPKREPDNFINHLLEFKNDKEKLTAEIIKELEIRVGRKIIEGLSRKQISDFERIIDNDIQFIGEWLDASYPAYAVSEKYCKFRYKGLEGDRLISQTAATLWTETNAPDYRQIVSDTRDEMIREIDNCDGLKDEVDFSAVFGNQAPKKQYASNLDTEIDVDDIDFYYEMIREDGLNEELRELDEDKLKVFKSMYKWELLSVKIEDLDFGARAYYILKRCAINTVGGIIAKSKDWFLRIPDLRKRVYDEIFHKIEQLGLEFAVSSETDDE